MKKEALIFNIRVGHSVLFSIKLFSERMVISMKYQEFLQAYDVVFDETGCIKPCGREMTQRLIQAALSIEPCGEFGDLQTGYMNVESIKKIRNTINTIE